MLFVAHVHFQDGKLISGAITQHKRPAEIIIFSPLNSLLCKAVVVMTPGIAHNHPPYSLQKRTFEATELYVEAIKSVGIIGAMVGQIDRGLLDSYTPTYIC